MRPQRRYPRVLFWALTSALAGVAQDPRPFEPYLVLRHRVELYDGAQRLPVRLYPGDVLPARPDELHDDWLDVVVDQKAYQVQAGGLGRLRDLEVAAAKRVAELTGRIEDLTRGIDALDEQIGQLYAAECAIRFDATLQYRYREAVPVPAPAPAPGGPGPARYPPLPPVQYIERYEDKIPVARARGLSERWARERDDLEEKARTLREQRRSRLGDRLATEAQRAFVTWRFAVFRADGISLAREPFVCIRGRTQLYADTTLVQELDADTVVVAAPNREDSQWLRVSWNGQLLDARRDGFLNRLGIETQLGQRAVWLEQAILDATAETEALSARRQLLEAVGLAADYASHLDYAVVRAYPFAADYRGRRYYPPPFCPSGAVEVVNRSRARSYIRHCDRELDDVADRLRDLEKDLRNWRRELAGLGPRIEDLRRRMDAAR